MHKIYASNGTPNALVAGDQFLADVPDSFLSRRLTAVRQFVCGMFGHQESGKHFGHKRITNKCRSCGHESNGWDLDVRPPRRRFEGDSKRHVLAKT